MKKILEFVMDSEEYGTVANIVGSQRRNAGLMADKLLKEDMPKEKISDFLHNMASELSIAENVLTDI